MHTPFRMCVACRKIKKKDEIIKFVKTQNGTELDIDMKKQGRGAYICKDRVCLENAKKKNALSKHFKLRIDDTVYINAQEAIDNE